MIPSLLRIFSIKGCGILLKAFSACIEIILVFVFSSFYVVNYVYRLVYVEPALHPQDEAFLIMMDKFLDLLSQSACQYFIEDFCIYVHHGYWPEVFFFLLSLCRVLVSG